MVKLAEVSLHGLLVMAVSWEERAPELWPLLQGLLMEFVQMTGHMDTSISECSVPSSSIHVHYPRG